MNASLARLMARPDIQLGHHLLQPKPNCSSTGWPALDAMLPGGGWAEGSLIELALPQPGCGELLLLWPSLARLSQARRSIVLINPPCIPFAPAWQGAGLALPQLVWLSPVSLNDALWACELSLRETSCGAVLFWLPQPLLERQILRLQKSASQGKGLGFLLMTPEQAQQGSPCSLRLALSSRPSGCEVRIDKLRGAPRPATTIVLRRQD